MTYRFKLGNNKLVLIKFIIALTCWQFDCGERNIEGMEDICQFPFLSLLLDLPVTLSF